MAACGLILATGDLEPRRSEAKFDKHGTTVDPMGHRNPRRHLICHPVMILFFCIFQSVGGTLSTCLAARKEEPKKKNRTEGGKRLTGLQPWTDCAGDQQGRILFKCSQRTPQVSAAEPFNVICSYAASVYAKFASSENRLRATPHHHPHHHHYRPLAAG